MGYCILFLLLAWVAVLVIRAALFTPRKASAPVAPLDEPIDEAAVATHMQAMIRVPTVSRLDKATEDPAPFEAFPALLAELYPRIHQHCAVERIGARGMLIRWAGKSADQPSVMMSHYDVVPADADKWQKPPFAGIIEDGVLWGRGTLDTKGTLLGALEAAESLIAEGFIPAHDLYFAFAGDEEIQGQGAPAIVETLMARGVRPAFVLDEGGAVVEGVFPGVKRPCALIGIAEKGAMDATFRIESRGGHASAPPPHTAIGQLAQAVVRIENAPFPFRLTQPARAMFDTLGRHSTFAMKLLFANLWCFAPVLNLLCRKTGGELNALVRTTCAFTQASGSAATNVLPPTATVGANLRLIDGETTDSAIARLQKLAGREIDISLARSTNPSAISHATGEAWQRLGDAVAATWPEAILSPYLMIAASDSRHYGRISEHVYRFSTMQLSSEQRKLIHGHDERVPLCTLYTTVRFYRRLMKHC